MRGFRNLADADLEIPAAGCVVVGPNGHGKTSLIEAALYCEVFRSFRGSPDRELVRFGAALFRVAVTLADGPAGGARDVAAAYDAGRRIKRVSVAGVTHARVAEGIGVMRGVVLSPGDVSLVAGGPRERRRYLDVLLSLTAPGYLEALTRYRRALAQRLRAAAGDAPAWEGLLAGHGAAIAAAREGWVAAWRERFAELCAAVGERGVAALAYAPRVAGGAAELAAALARQRQRDLARGQAGAGPHRDDLRLQLDGRDLRTYGSAGQQRTAALALRVCEAETLAAHGSPATLCLDDAFAELDDARSARLARLVESMAAAGSQVIAAVPKAQDVPDALRALAIWSIHEGRIT